VLICDSGRDVTPVFPRMAMQGHMTLLPSIHYFFSRFIPRVLTSLAQGQWSQSPRARDCLVLLFRPRSDLIDAHVMREPHIAALRRRRFLRHHAASVLLSRSSRVSNGLIFFIRPYITISRCSTQTFCLAALCVTRGLSARSSGHVSVGNDDFPALAFGAASCRNLPPSVAS
jgi:hypothetical protein